MPERTLPTDLREWINSAEWREAVTYRRTWPHEYVVKDRLPPEGQRSFEAFARWYRANAYEGRFWRTVVWYVDLDGFTYWMSTDAPIEELNILNRCPIEESYMWLEAHGLIKQRLAERRG